MKQKPQKLKKGDTIGIISPAGVVKEHDKFDRAKAYIESKGFNVKAAPHALDKKDYLAGSDEHRLADLVNFFNDPEVNAIFCSRGGYGTLRIIDKLPELPPKILVGFSDITSLLNNLNFVTFHGPLELYDFSKEPVNSYTEEIFWKVLMGEVKIPFSYQNPYEYHCINPGQVKGKLVGGNLAIICAMLASPYCVDFTDNILLLEDVGEPLYKIDRLLVQLRLAGVFEKVAGVLFAESTDVDSLELVKEYFSGYNFPVGYGFPAGHSEYKVTLPIGVDYFFDSENFKLELTEDYILA